MEDKLWKKYWKDPTDANRNALVLIYKDIVKFFALKFKSNAVLNFDDLISVGTIAVMNCIPKFDKTKGILFTTFIQRRIFGEMKDEFRRMDHVPRLVRLRGEEPQLLTHISSLLPEDSKHLDYWGYEEDNGIKDYYEWVSKGLLPEEQFALKLRLDGLTLKTIGETIGISESRVSQVFSWIIKPHIESRLCA